MATGKASSEFNATQYLEETVGINPSTDALTAATLFNRDNLTSNEILQQNNGPSTGRTWLEHWDYGSGDKSDSFLGGAATTGTTTINAGTWYQMAMTFGGGTDTVRIYTDAVEENSNSDTGESSNGSMLVGASKGPSAQYDGKMATMQIWNRVLTADELNEVRWNPFSIPQDLVWMPEMWGTDYHDLSPTQKGTPTESGTIAASSDGPPIYFLGGQ